MFTDIHILYQVGDPPRVWDDTLEKPGCAFTRSIGDAVGKGCGISAEPEILVWEITENDKFAIVASDGVFEFITSQGVVDMVAKYASPVEAAKHVVAEAYRLWLTYDDRTDDITMIIINFDDIREKISTDMKESDNHNHTRIGSLSKAASMRNVNVITSKNIRNTNKPVRKVMSRAKRKDISDNFVHDEKATFDFANIVNTKVFDGREVDTCSYANYSLLT